MSNRVTPYLDPFPPPPKAIDPDPVGGALQMRAGQPGPVGFQHGFSNLGIWLPAFEYFNAPALCRKAAAAASGCGHKFAQVEITVEGDRLWIHVCNLTTRLLRCDVTQRVVAAVLGESVVVVD